MALVPEDGTGNNPAADTFATVVELRAFAAKRGATVPAAGTEGDAACEVLLTKAMDFIQACEERLQGCRTFEMQPLCVPRVGMRVYGRYIASNVIPVDFKNAQCQLAIDAQTVDLMPTIDPATQQGPVVREKVDVLEVQYAEPTQQRTAPLLARAEALLRKFFSYGTGQVRLVRA